MAKAARSPVLGYNHNVRYHGRIYHVQTEDSGASHARIFTHLFYEGTILASKRHDYAPSATENDVRAFMQEQHKAILKELKRGLYDDRIVQHFTALGEDPFLDQVAEAMPTLPAQAEDVGQTAPLPAEPAAAEQPAAAESFAELPEQVPVSESFSTSEAVPDYAVTAHGDAPVIAHTPGAPVSDEDIVILDLDALPPVVEEPPQPEPIAPAQPPNVQRPFGAGVYVKKGGTTERPFDRTMGPLGTGSMPARRASPVPPVRKTGTQASVRGSERQRSPVPERPTLNSPLQRPIPGRPGVSQPVTRPPVVVIRPPVRPRPQPPTATTAPPGGVVVQRTVVVGAGGPVVAQRPRRPRPAVPYVVKEGSHPIVRNPGAAQLAPPIQRPASIQGPNMARRIASPPPHATTISDKSLDEVILAYLSQDGDGKR